jgi:hypothetical protein
MTLKLCMWATFPECSFAVIFHSVIETVLCLIAVLSLDVSNCAAFAFHAIPKLQVTPGFGFATGRTIASIMLHTAAFEVFQELSTNHFGEDLRTGATSTFGSEDTNQHKGQNKHHEDWIHCELLA